MLRFLLTALICLLAIPLSSSHVDAQVGGGTYPSLSYYSAYSALREGEIKLALEAFQQTTRSGMRTVEGPWIDAVCYRVMVGEAYLRAGETQLAIDQYNSALHLMFQHREWLKRVQFPGGVQASSRRISPPVNWGTGLRQVKYADVPNKFPIILGNLNNDAVIRQGGRVVPAELHSINVHEIIRCACLALRRRYELLGPVAEHDPLTVQMVVAFEGRMGQPNHWSQAWLNVQRGWALAVAGKPDEAAAAFQAAVLLGGRFDHPLTATALMGLGYLARDTGHPNEAKQYLISASVAAAVFEEVETVEDALIAASDIHLAGAPNQPLADLSLAAAWATRQRLSHLNAAMTTLVAENLTTLRQTAAAGKLLAKAQSSLPRRASMSAALNARAEFVASQIHYQQGKLVAAQTTFQSAVKRQRAISPWLYQIATTSKLYRNRNFAITSRSLNTLFDELLREPTPQDWNFHTLDTLTFILTPNRGAHEDWFDLAMNRDESRKALEIGETIRRRRFYSQLPLGGRVLSLRWCLEAPDAVLTEEAKVARQDILARYPAYKALSDKSRQLRDGLDQIPINVSDEQSSEQKKLALELDNVSALQESMLGEIALRREACPFVFPPQMTSKAVQESLQPKQLALIYVSTAKELHAFMLSRDDYVHWEMPAVGQIRRDAMALLKDWGMTGENTQLTTETLRGSAWRKTGETLLRSVIDRGQHGFWNKYDELIIVPDGLLWYVPFEGLPVEIPKTRSNAGAAAQGPDPVVEKPAGEDAADNGRKGSRPVKRRGKDDIDDGADWQPLISQIRVRYVPTAGLINAPRLPAARDARTAVVLGKLFPRDDQDIAKTQLESIEQVAEGYVALPTKLTADSGLLRCTWGGLVVFDDITDLREGPLDWSPARVDEGRPGARLRRWLVLPWGGPSQIVLPGFHTLTEAGMKTEGDGNELFTTSMAFMASGARTVVLSRWRTGGLSSYDLIREFLQEEGDISPSDAWQRSLQVMRQSEIDPKWEPRVTTGRDKDPLSGEHPFFWAGYMLLGG